MVAAMDPALLEPGRFRGLRRDEYERLAELGAFDHEKVELLRGVVVSVSPQGPPHAWLVARINEVLVLALRGGHTVRPQLPMAAADDSMPEPDLAVVAPTPRGSPHPGPDAVALVVEVSASSLAIDRRVKAEIYAAGGVPEYWVVDVEARVVHRHTEPSGARPGRFHRVEVLGPGQVIAPVGLPGHTFAVADLLGD